jgi:hypothetical protein
MKQATTAAELFDTRFASITKVIPFNKAWANGTRVFRRRSCRR